MTIEEHDVHTPPQSRSLSSERLPSALKMFHHIVNMRFPEEELGGKDRIPQRKYELASKKAREVTESFWPELWQGDLWQALDILREMRNLLRGFWQEKERRAQDWYIHRIRECYQTFRIRGEIVSRRKEVDELAERRIRELLKFKESAPQRKEHRLQREELANLIMPLRNTPLQEKSRPFLGLIHPPSGDAMLTPASVADEISAAFSNLYADIQKSLATPQAPTSFEDALYSLQERASFPSRAPHVCENEKCETSNRFFFKCKTRYKYCCPACSDEGRRKSENRWWQDNKEEQNAKRRKN